jgi:hypothetical protein
MAVLALSMANANGARAATLVNSPPGEVTIITNNLLEGFGDRDLTDMTEVNVFTGRVLDKVPYIPDMLLLQEVRSKSASYVAELMTKKTNQTFVVAVDAGVKPWWQTETKVIKMDTAIVINAHTMTEIGPGGYIQTRYARPNSKPEYKKNARGYFEEKLGGARVAAVSIHIPGVNLERKVKNLSSALDAAYPPSGIDHFTVLGGDLNALGLVRDASGKLVPTRWWKTVTSDPYSYQDTVFAFRKVRGIDYVFARETGLDAGVDSTYDPIAAKDDSTSFYSDHKFRWANVGPDIEPPSAPTNLSTYSKWACCGDTRVKLTWTASTDTGSGVHSYGVYRSTDRQTYEQVGTASRTTYFDEEVNNGKRYYYRVVARDVAGNTSMPSSVTSCVAGEN